EGWTPLAGGHTPAAAASPPALCTRANPARTRPAASAEGTGIPVLSARHRRKAATPGLLIGLGLPARRAAGPGGLASIDPPLPRGASAAGAHQSRQSLCDLGQGLDRVR